MDIWDVSVCGKPQGDLAVVDGKLLEQRIGSCVGNDRDGDCPEKTSMCRGQWNTSLEKKQCGLFSFVDGGEMEWKWTGIYVAEMAEEMKWLEKTCTGVETSSSGDGAEGWKHLWRMSTERRKAGRFFVKEGGVGYGRDSSSDSSNMSCRRYHIVIVVI